MSLKKNTKQVHTTMSELNITPLLDLVFVLLVIFIITTPQMLNSLPTTLPSSKPPKDKPDEKPKFTTVKVYDNGDTYLNGSPVTIAQLKSGLQRLKDSDPELAVVVQGSDVVEYQKMVNVLGVLSELDITKIGLKTADQ
ncbi:MAG TPA: biopolymer transporter ExbD [Verrucomicrobiae bacterium]|nr:biopolymer transporter ExbD [Verrucomicrobiae bacterium]